MTSETLHSPFFSIVMPVYNVEPYVEEAICCIQNQTCKDWELIVIDDATPDGSMQIVECAAQHDPRIKIITQPDNMGASHARNTGMDAAGGAYIWFADADDSFDSDLLERTKAEIEATSAQIILFGLREDYYDAQDKLLYSNELSIPPARYSEPAEWQNKIIDLEQDTHFGYAACKIYELDFLRNEGARFKDLLLAEDFAFNIDAFTHAQSIAIINGTPYHYRKIDGRSTTNANAYTYAQYYELVYRRIESLKALLEKWGVFDEHARAILGSLFGRYIISAIERSFHANANVSSKERKAFVQGIIDDPLFCALIPYAQAKNSRATARGLKVLQSKNVNACIRFGKMVHFARVHLYSLFTKIRSGR